MPYYASTEIVGSNVAANLANTGILPIRRPALTPDKAGILLSAQGQITFASGVNLALNDVIEMVILPYGAVPQFYILTMDQFDSNGAATFAVQLGTMTGSVGDTSRTNANNNGEGGTAIKCGGAPAGNLTTPGFTNGAGNGAFAAAYFTQTLVRTAPIFAVGGGYNTVDRSFGIAVTAAAATNPATLRRMDLQLFYRFARQLG